MTSLAVFPRGGGSRSQTVASRPLLLLTFLIGLQVTLGFLARHRLIPIRKKPGPRGGFAAFRNEPDTPHQSQQVDVLGEMPCLATSGSSSSSSSTVSSLNGDNRSSDGEGSSGPWVSYVAECDMPTERGMFRMRSYRCFGKFSRLEPVAMVYGDVRGKDDVLVRIHDQCLTSEVFGSKRCDCKEQLEMALDRVREAGGVVIYLQQEGRGIGLANKVAAYALQDGGLDTVDANRHLGFQDDERAYDIIPTILEDMGIRSISLMTNNPFKVRTLEGLGVTINKIVPIIVQPNVFNQQYLQTKAERMSHALITRHPRGGSSSSSSGSISPSSSSMTPRRRWQPKAGSQSIQAAVQKLMAGQPVVVVDGSEPSSVADVILAAEKATPEGINGLMKASNGILYVMLEEARLESLSRSSSKGLWGGVDLIVTSSSKEGEDIEWPSSSVTSKALTVRALADREMGGDAFQSPGHVFPMAVPDNGGRRAVAMELMRMAGLQPAVAMVEMVSRKNRSEVAELSEALSMANSEGFPVVSACDVTRLLSAEKAAAARATPSAGATRSGRGGLQSSNSGTTTSGIAPSSSPLPMGDGGDFEGLSFT